MINLVINNNTVYEMEDKLLMILVHRFTQDRDVWHQFQQSWWPENREATMDRLNRLKTGDNIICAHTFDGWQQLEIMAGILDTFKMRNVKLNVYISNVDLQEKFNEYFEELESDITPNTEEYNDSWEKRRQFKQVMNELVANQIKFHNVCQLGYNENYDKGYRRSRNIVVYLYSIKYNINVSGHKERQSTLHHAHIRKFRKPIPYRTQGEQRHITGVVWMDHIPFGGYIHRGIYCEHRV